MGGDIGILLNSLWGKAVSQPPVPCRNGESAAAVSRALSSTIG
jgi:hypothetical protein